MKKDSKQPSGKKTIVSCPTCDKEVIWNTQYSFRPFCSERCKLIDLGEWANEEKRIAGDSVDSESDIDYDQFLQ